MLYMTYLRRELRHRMRQAVFIALGLALGVGLVITVSAATTGARNAQSDVLHALYGIGTDISVTKAWTPGSTSHHGADAGKHSTTLDYLDNSALGPIPEPDVPRIARLHDVAAAVGQLSLLDTKITLPSSLSPGAGSGTGGSTSSSGTSGSGGAGQGLPLPVEISVDGVNPAISGIGPLASAKLISGRAFRATDATSDVALADINYAKQKGLKIGSTVTLAGTRFTVIGIVSQGASPPEVLIPLARAQTLADMENEVNTIYVAAASAADIPAVSAEIAKVVPSASVTTSSSLATEITGSLADAANLAKDLGRWLAIAVLAGAFALASLLTIAAVSRRVREFGTLKALGWATRRIVAQILGESITIGFVGALLGIVLGIGGAELVSAVAPTLSATVAAAPGSQEPQGTLIGPSGESHFTAPGSYHTVPIHFAAPVTATPVVLAVVLGIAGGLLAGVLGSWRAARMRPAAALARVG
jgi:putative ABC transport system permease protein